MGLMGRILGAGSAVREVGGAVGGVAEVFTGNRAEREAAEAAAFQAAVQQYGEEFRQTAGGWFDRFMNGLNRLPRPLLTLGTLALFVYAMIEPLGFSARMEGLALVPEPLWWLLGAIVSFYFGARELHHQRMRGALPLMGIAARVRGAVADPARTPDVPAPAAAPGQPVSLFGWSGDAPTTGPVPVRAADPDFNAAVEEWRLQRG